MECYARATNEPLPICSVQCQVYISVVRINSISVYSNLTKVQTQICIYATHLCIAIWDLNALLVDIYDCTFVRAP